MKKIRLIIFACLAIGLVTLCCVFFLNKCSSQSDGQKSINAIDTLPSMVTQMQRCSRLNVAEVKLHKIITHDDQMKVSGKLFGKELSIDIPAGKRKVAIPMYATVKASIDMTKIKEEDIQRNGDKIEIFLPMPETIITETHIDHEGVRQYVALTRSNFSDEELQNYEKQGRDAIEKDIPNLGIEAMAKESAARQLIPIIQSMGYEEQNIIISFRKDDKTNTILRQDR